MRFDSRWLFVTVVLLLAGCGGSREPATLVLKNGKIVTLGDGGLGEVQALAARDDRIVAVGSNSDIEAFVGAGTEVIDLDGQLAVPGFIEGHAHFTGIGESKLNLNLMNVSNWAEIVDMVERTARDTPPGEWITGRGWHQEKWDEVPEPNIDGLPTHDSLSAASPDNPVVLRHASGHASFANAKAMELAGIDAGTTAPEGGEIVKDSRGRPIGMFRETAQRLLRRAGNAADDMSEEERAIRFERVVELATDECLSKGVTSFQDAGSSLQTVDRFKVMAEAGDLRIRLWVMLRDGNQALSERLPNYKIIGAGNNFLTVRAIKRTIDGALGPHGAWLLQPYRDMPSSSGLNTSSVDSVTETARLAAEHGFQMCVHAIGDRANREVLDIFEQIFEANPDKTDLRWRIEHAQHINAADIPRFGELGVIASMQGIHCTSDGPWVYERLGAERAEEGAYVWQKLMQTGALVTNGTDGPVEDVDPIASYYATVSRMMKNGERFFPEQAMSREEALRSYTINVARAGFEEDLKGTLEVGKLADITVLSRDILTIAEEEIPGTQVVYTIVGGEVAWPKR